MSSSKKKLPSYDDRNEPVVKEMAKEELVQHIKVPDTHMRNEGVDIAKKYACTLMATGEARDPCTASFTTKQALTNHIRSHYPDLKETYKSDIIRCWVKLTEITADDPVKNVSVFVQTISIPNGFKLISSTMKYVDGNKLEFWAIRDNRGEKE